MEGGREGVRGDGGGREEGRGEREEGERGMRQKSNCLIIIQHTSIVSIIKIRLSNVNDLFNPIHLPLVLSL